MTSPFKEAHQFKGVPIDVGMMAAADALEKSAVGEAHETSKTVAAMRAKAKPAHTREVSMGFADGTFFDVQEDHTGQYLVLEPDQGNRRPRCHVGDWIVQMGNGSFLVLSDENYKAMGGQPEASTGAKATA